MGPTRQFGDKSNTQKAHLSETSIEDSVRDLIGDLVRVTLTDRLGGEEEAVMGKNDNEVMTRDDGERGAKEVRRMSRTRRI